MKKIKNDKKGYGRGTFIETVMMLSKAYQSLGVPRSAEIVSSFSHVLLDQFLLKRQFGKVPDRKNYKTHQRTDDNRFTMPYKKLQKPPFNCSQTRITRAFDELLEKGFINNVDPGGAYEKHKAVYELVEDWVNWKPGDPPIRKRKKDARRGFQGRKLGAVKNKNNTHGRCTPTHTRTLHTRSGGHTHGRCTPRIV